MILSNTHELPSCISIETEGAEHTVSRVKPSNTIKDINLDLESLPGNQLAVSITASKSKIRTIKLFWDSGVSEDSLFMGDHWERSYGDLEWRGLRPERIFPWYVLETNKEGTGACGVKTGANSFAYWQVTSSWVMVCLNVKNGTHGVDLQGRTLDVATILSHNPVEEMSPFATGKAFCKQLCDEPRLPDYPVYGGNDWYCRYGKNTRETVLADADYLSRLAGPLENRPFMTIDAGWHVNGSCNPGPWFENSYFKDIHLLADQIRDKGARPGIWIRPLFTAERLPESYFLKRLPDGAGRIDRILDPSVPEALEIVEKDVQRLSQQWGFDLIKHDFTTYDLFGLWGFEMSDTLSSGDWHFSDTGKTSAEIVKDLYSAIRKGAGNALVIGCNTIGHLGAGLFELQRTGDDTSGITWERTRRMGINTLAFRGMQNETFFMVDADCVGMAGKIDWALNQQWLDLLARSATPLFVSVLPDRTSADQKQALKEAFKLASQPGELIEPQDWLYNASPAIWKSKGEVISYQWNLSKKEGFSLEDIIGRD